MLPGTQNAGSHALYQESGIPERYGVSARSGGGIGATFICLVDSNLRRVRVMLVDDQICLVVTDIRTIDCNAARDGAWLQTKQGLVQLSPVVGEIQRRNT